MLEGEKTPEFQNWPPFFFLLLPFSFLCIFWALPPCTFIQKIISKKESALFLKNDTLAPTQKQKALGWAWLRRKRVFQLPPRCLQVREHVLGMWDVG